MIFDALTDIICCPGAPITGCRRPSRVGPRLEKVDMLPTPGPFVMKEATEMISLEVPGTETVRELSSWGPTNLGIGGPRWIQASNRPLPAEVPCRVKA